MATRRIMGKLQRCYCRLATFNIVSYCVIIVTRFEVECLNFHAIRALCSYACDLEAQGFGPSVILALMTNEFKLQLPISGYDRYYIALSHSVSSEECAGM
jgi:hypothetical protein